MKVVYIIKSNKDQSAYVGVTGDLTDRFKRHNEGRVPSTKDRLPWKLVCHLTFEDNQTAYDFERYLKSGSGRAFLKKHFLS